MSDGVANDDQAALGQIRDNRDLGASAMIHQTVTQSLASFRIKQVLQIATLLGRDLLGPHRFQYGVRRSHQSVSHFGSRTPRFTCEPRSYQPEHSLCQLPCQQSTR